MVVRKVKKNRKTRGFNRLRGSGRRTRGAGNRGGRGRAGLGKRAAQNKLMYLRFRDELGFIGKRGFTSIYKKEKGNALNISQLDKLADKFVASKQAELKNKVYIIDLTKIGYTKLIGSGKVNKKFDITVGSVSSKAKARIEEAGGKIIGAEEDNDSEEATEKE